ncbi:MAG: hypothetical protein ACE5MB_08895 [Anaerolineae bacterium]
MRESLSPGGVIYPPPFVAINTQQGDYLGSLETEKMPKLNFRTTVIALILILLGASAAFGILTYWLIR